MKFFKNVDSLTKLTGKNIVYTFVLKGLSFIISLLYVPILLSCLDEKIYGVWLALTSVVSWLSLFDIGIGNGLKNKLTESLAVNNIEYSRKLVSTSYVYSALIFSVILVISLIINCFIKWNLLLNVEQIFNNDLTITAFLVIIAFCVRFILQIITPVLAATQNIRFNSLIEFIGKIGAFIGVILLNYLGVKSIIIFTIVVLYVPLIILFVFSIYLYSNKLKELRPCIRFSDKQHFSEIFSLGINFFIIQISAIVIFQTNSFLIANSFGPADVTKYNIVFKYYNILILLWGILMTPLWPSYTNAYILGNYKWIKKSVKYCLFMFLLTIIVAVIMAFVGPAVIEYWLGQDLNISKSLLLAMLLFALVSIWNNIFGCVVGAIGKVRLGVYSTSLSALIFFPLFYLLKSLGLAIEGAIWSIIICISLSAFLSPIQIYYFIYTKKKSLFLTKLLS